MRADEGLRALVASCRDIRLRSGRRCSHPVASQQSLSQIGVQMSDFTEAQRKRAAAFGGHLCPSRIINFMVHEGNGRVSMSRQVRALCPILKTDDGADMVILPDGREYWVAR